MIAEPNCSDAHIYHMNIGNTFQYSLSNTQAAIAEYKQSLDMNDKYGLCHLNLGNALATAGNKQGAARAYRNAIELQPDPLICVVASQCKKLKVSRSSVFGSLRFRRGETVVCLLGRGLWQVGTVVDLWYDEYEQSMSWPGDKISPYQVRLENGDLICAPVDDDMAIKLHR